MGWFSNDDETAGKAAGEGDATADKAAGGFGRGGQSRPVREHSEEYTRAYDRAYKKNS